MSLSGGKRRVDTKAFELLYSTENARKRVASQRRASSVINHPQMGSIPVHFR
jgi:hypothetical protein